MSRRCCFLFILAWTCAVPGIVIAQQSSVLQSSRAPQVSSQNPAIPAGTILPIILRTTIAPSKAKQGQIIRGEIAQDVPLAGDGKISKGSKIEGEVVQAIRTGNGAGTKISIRFDKIYLRGQLIPVTANLRAIAGFMDVLDAYTPNQAIGEGDVAQWMTTTQIGGDSVFGIGGPVTSAHDASQVIGTAPMSGGVLVQVSANPLRGCRGPIGDKTAPQALWVFSSDACGVYGLSSVSISQSGRTEPLGTITLDVTAPKAKIQSGAGLLLRVIG